MGAFCLPTVANHTPSLYHPALGGCQMASAAAWLAWAARGQLTFVAFWPAWTAGWRSPGVLDAALPA